MTSTADTRYGARIRRVVDHVRRNLDADLSVDSLAAVACFSPYHFHRVFRATTGETVTRFVQRARLERAAYLMKSAPSRSLGSIALDAGFSSQSDFSRVFRAAYGLAPSAWDRRSRLEQGELIDEPGPGPGRFGAPDPPIETEVRRHPACTVVYVRMTNAFSGDTLPVHYRKLTDWLDRRGMPWRSQPLMGVSWDHYDITPLDQVRFDLGFHVGPAHEDIAADDTVGVHRFPAVQAVDAHSSGPLLRIAQAWDHLYLEWLPGSGYEPADLPAMKRFRRRPDETGWDTWDVDCSIALRPLGP